MFTKIAENSMKMFNFVGLMGFYAQIVTQWNNGNES